MTALSAEDIWSLSDSELLNLLNTGILVQEPRQVRFFTPSFMPYQTRHHSNSSDKRFPTISITGNSCALNCKHCQGKVLQTMNSATTPEELYTLCAQLKQKGAVGCLISGGCRPDGSVPLERFIPAIAKVKLDLGLTVLVHTGKIGAEAAGQLKSAGVDSALIDVIGSTQTIRQTFNLDVTDADFERSLEALEGSGLNVVPHVIVGLHDGELRGEFAALKMISRHKHSAVVIIAFMPIPSTLMAKTPPPKPIAIARTAAAARTLLPKTPLALGCMRPKGKNRQETDILALEAGVNAIAYPTEAAIEYAQNKGYKTSFSPLCCAQIFI